MIQFMALFNILTIYIRVLLFMIIFCLFPELIIPLLFLKQIPYIISIYPIYSFFISLTILGMTLSNPQFRNHLYMSYDYIRYKINNYNIEHKNKVDSIEKTDNSDNSNKKPVKRKYIKKISKTTNKKNTGWTAYNVQNKNLDISQPIKLRRSQRLINAKNRISSLNETLSDNVEYDQNYQISQWENDGGRIELDNECNCNNDRESENKNEQIKLNNDNDISGLNSDINEWLDECGNPIDINNQ